MKDTALRYMAYTARLSRVITRMRYMAYSSEVGEALRPVMSPWIIRGAYVASFGYCAADVFEKGHEEHQKGSDRMTIVNKTTRTALFQLFASMLLPPILVHTQVKYTSVFFQKRGSPFLRKWGASIGALACIPLLPYILDHPVEYGVDFVCDRLEPIVWGVPAKEKPKAH
eukprot:GGOE01060964.1.p1 GENE.GGOE01060964.1~~GGOE01060964.1.p1  ORF type:complete len:197 (+),score=64.54 GGOE01060964.1:84-593(+)